MYRTERSKVGHLARAGLALAAFLLMLPAPGHAVTLNVTDDAFISLSNTAKNFGSRKRVVVDGLIGREGFAKFDLSVLGGSNIDSATLRIWITKVKVAGSIDIHRVIDIGGSDWTEDTLTGDDLSGGDPLSTVFFSNVGITSSDKNSFVLVDVTSLVQDWLDGTLDNDGISLLPVGGTRVIIDAKEGKKTSHPMEIEVILGASSTIIGGGTHDVDLDDTTDRFVPMFYGSSNSDETLVQQAMTVKGIVSDFYVFLEATPEFNATTDRYEFTVRIDPGPAGGGDDIDTDVGATDANPCTIDGVAEAIGRFWCADLVDTHCFDAGDLISIKAHPESAPTARTMRWTAKFTPDATCTN